MEKYRTCILTFPHNFIFKKIGFILLLLLGVSWLTAKGANGDKKITITFNAGEKLDHALKRLEGVSGVTMAYDPKATSVITLKAKTFINAELTEVLKFLLTDADFSFKNESGSILIYKSPNAAAGGGPGTLKGRIVEFETSQPLPAASIYIVELQRGMQSNMDGYYTFSNIPAGKYTLQVSYVSFSTEKVSVEVKAGKEETYDVKMRGSNALSEVVVSGTRKSRAPVSHTTERQLVGELKAAQSVVSGISSEQISKSADRNAAEAIKKVAGVTVRDDRFIIIRGMNERYNLTYLNNNIAPSTELYSRAFSLDLIPTRIIDRILVYKSPAPDLLADMTGGAVKIFTKDAKNVKHFDIEVQTGYKENTTFNKNFLTYKGSGTDFLGFDNGLRKLPSVIPPFGDFTKAAISQSAYAGAFSNILNYSKQTGAPPIQLTANYYNSYKIAGKSLSMLSSFSYKNEPVHLDIDRTQGNLTYLQDPNFSTLVAKISTESQNTQTAQLTLLQNFTYHLRDSSTLYFKNFLLQQGQSATILRNTSTGQSFRDGLWRNADAGNIALRDIILSYTQRFLYSGNLGGSQHWGKSGEQNLEWNGGYTFSRLDVPDQRVSHLQNNIINDGRFPQGADYEQNWVPVFRKEDYSKEGGDPLLLGMISRTWIRNTEQVYNASADYTYKFKPWITLKAGTYQQWKQREVYRKAFTVNEGDLNNTGFADPGNSIIGSNGTQMDYNLVFFHQQDLGQVWSSKYLRDNGTALKVFDRTNGSDAYIATEQNNSGYLAASLLPFNGKLDIYGGLRVEYDRQKVAGALAPGNGAVGTAGGINTPLFADLQSAQFLPSINIGYRPNNSWVFRVAYGRTLNRPEFRELSPYSELDYLNNQTIQGNPDLQFAKVNNYDLRMEWYPNANTKGETISLGAFYKQLDHPIERVIYNDLNLSGASTQITFLNANSAKVRGLELDIRKNLDFLPGSLFRDLSVIANGSWIYSKVDSIGAGLNADSRNVSRQLQGQSPYAVNAGLYYENAGKGTKIAIIFNQVGPRIYAAAVGKEASLTGPIASRGNQGSLIELTRRQLDFSLTQRLVKSLQARLSIQNLLNSPVQMAEDANFTYKYEKPVFTATTPSNPGQKSADHISGDLLASDYRPGRFYLITLTYSF